MLFGVLRSLVCSFDEFRTKLRHVCLITCSKIFLKLDCWHLPYGELRMLFIG